jgi:hypothetical protein
MNTYTQFEGATTDINHFMWLTAHPFARHYGTAGTGVILDNSNNTNHMTRFGDAYYRIEWLEFTNFDDSNDFALDIDANNIVVANLLFYDYDGGTAGGAIRSSSGTNQTARNCIIYHGQGYGIRIGGGTLSVENCAEGIRLRQCPKHHCHGML